MEVVFAWSMLVCIGLLLLYIAVDSMFFLTSIFIDVSQKDIDKDLEGDYSFPDVSSVNREVYNGRVLEEQE